MKIIISIYVFFVLTSFAKANEISTQLDNSLDSNVSSEFKSKVIFISESKLDYDSLLKSDAGKFIYDYFKNLTVCIKGNVVDDKGRPIKGVTIKIIQVRTRMGKKYPSEVNIKTQEWLTKTDSYGRYVVKDVPAVWPTVLAMALILDRAFPSNLLVTASYPEYEDKSTDVVSADKKIVSIAMASIPIVEKIANFSQNFRPEINYKPNVPKIFLNDSVIVNMVLSKKK